MSNSIYRFIVAANYADAKRYAGTHKLSKFYYVSRADKLMGLVRGTIIIVLPNAHENPIFGDIMQIAKIRRFEVLYAEL